MKKVTTILTLSVALSSLALPGRASPADDLAFNEQVRGQALKLFSNQKPTDAVAYLAANLHSIQGGDPTTELVQQLTTVAFTLHNSHDHAIAVVAATQAVSAGSPLLHSAARDGFRSSTLTNLGVLAEVVLHDPVSARSYYAAALDAQPSNVQAKTAIAAIDAKAKGRPGLKN